MNPSQAIGFIEVRKLAMRMMFLGSRNQLREQERDHVILASIARIVDDGARGNLGDVLRKVTGSSLSLSEMGEEFIEGARVRMSAEIRSLEQADPEWAERAAWWPDGWRDCLVEG